MGREAKRTTIGMKRPTKR